MLSNQQLRENATLFESISAESTHQLAQVVCDSIQFDTNLQTQLASLEISDATTTETLADTILSFIHRLLQSRSASSDCQQTLVNLGFSEEHAAAMATVIGERLDSIARALASRSSGDRLSDLEWRFGLTAASNTGTSAPFVQFRLQFDSIEPVSVEMGMNEFYEFAGDIKRIQQQMSDSLGV